jgi:3-hydroxyisobutyrate dehydrogenase
MSVAIRVGFIGLGQMGSVIARSILASGFEMTVWDIRQSVIEPFLAAGASAAGSAADVAAGCDVVGICVVDDGQLLQVFEGGDGLLAGAGSGTVFVVHSTVSPDLCRALGPRVEEKGAHLVDAPVSRFNSRDPNSKIVVMVGGAEEPVGMAMPVLQAFGDPVLYFGPLGSGLLAKLVNQTLQSANAALGDEALDLGASFGLDVEELGRLLTTGSGRSFGLELALMARKADISAGLALLRKDVGLMAATRKQAGMDGDLIDAALRFVGPA